MAAPTTTGRRTARLTSRIAAPGISRIAGMAPATGRTDRRTARHTAPRITGRTGRRIARCITGLITASPA